MLPTVFLIVYILCFGVVNAASDLLYVWAWLSLFVFQFVCVRMLLRACVRGWLYLDSFPDGFHLRLLISFLTSDSAVCSPNTLLFISQFMLCTHNLQ